jgi:hypothetical protein
MDISSFARINGFISVNEKLISESKEAIDSSLALMRKIDAGGPRTATRRLMMKDSHIAALSEMDRALRSDYD